VEYDQTVKSEGTQLSTKPNVKVNIIDPKRVYAPQNIDRLWPLVRYPYLQQANNFKPRVN